MLLKFKDSFTIATICLGFSVIYFASHGLFSFASAMIIVGGVFDALDGLVARITKTANRFGGELDLVADLIIYTVAPAVLIFFMLQQFMAWFALLVGAFLLVCGCVRLARFNVKRIEYPGYFIGLTRPGLAYIVVSFLMSSFYVAFSDSSFFLIGVGVFIMALSLLNVSFLPYVGHHKRKFSRIHYLVLLIFVGIVVVSLFVGHFWDVIFGASLVYLVSPLFVPRETMKKINVFVREWKKEERKEERA